MAEFERESTLDGRQLPGRLLLRGAHYVSLKRHASILAALSKTNGCPDNAHESTNKNCNSTKTGKQNIVIRVTETGGNNSM